MSKSNPPIVLPDFVADTSSLNFAENVIRRVIKAPYKKGRHYFISLDRPVTAYDVFVVSGKTHIKYCAMQFIKFLADGSSLYRFRRVDNFNITSVDINNLQPKTKIIIKGNINQKYGSVRYQENPRGQNQ
jgi:hypothetical protein